MLDLLPLADWQAHEGNHRRVVEDRTRDHLARRDRGLKHPIEDFLFEYYGLTPGRLRRWHPGPGVILGDAAGLPRAGWRHYRQIGTGVTLDLEGFRAARGSVLEFTASLLSATLDRPASLGCLGLHEWAMVYQVPAQELRHDKWPLRLGSTGTDQVVRSHSLRCTHADAYRFFTPAALPRNALRPTRDGQVTQEQPGCLHAGMDLYKWCFKLEPLIPSELTIAAFDLARELRLLDMAASPYELSALGIDPVPIETPEGKVNFVAAQRGFAARSNTLRHRLLSVIEAALVSPTTGEAR